MANARYLFVDVGVISQNGRGDGKLTALELRSGLERLMTHIARRECCCRAYKCDRIPNYGLPPQADAQARLSVADGDGTVRKTPGRGVGQDLPDRLGHEQDACKPLQSESTGAFDRTSAPTKATVSVEVGSPDAAEKQCSQLDDKGTEIGRPGAADIGDPRSCEARLHKGEQLAHSHGRAGAYAAEGGRGKGNTSAQRGQTLQGGTIGGTDSAVPTSQEGITDAPNDEDPEAIFKGKGQDADGEEANSGEKSSSGLLLYGRAIACREHALEGMVYLGQRYLL